MTEAKQQVETLAKEAGRNPWIDRMARLGFAVRGLLYATIGLLAIQLIFTGTGELTGRQGALETIARQPLGEILLIVIAVGLLGMVIFTVVRAVADPYREGRDAKGIIARAGSVVTGLSYMALLHPTLRLVVGPDVSSGAESQEAQRVAAGTFTQPWGPWLVGVAGVVLIIVGLGQIYSALTRRFDDHFKLYEMTAEQREWVDRMGSVGTIALGVVLGVTGFLAILAALTLDPQKVGGIDSALAFLTQQPYGPYLLGVVALGLIAYAVFSFMTALWLKIKEA